MNELWKTDASISARLKAIGKALDAGRRVLVFDEGFVRINDEDESEVMKNVAGQEAGSQSGSRSGQRARARRTQSASHPFRSDALEAAYGTEFRILAQHYEALKFEDRNGLWVVVPSYPLGPRGPEVYFVIALPIDQRIAPRAWAIERVGRNAEPMSLKHTNFPDASICAFPYGSIPWPYSEGLLGLVDIYVLWAGRKLHRDWLGWWPGPQVGACSYYRTREFDAREDCGCGSGKRYGSCHMPPDILANSDRAKREFERLFECEFDDRRTPLAVLAFARSRWSKIPSMAVVFSARKDPTQLQLT